MDFFFAKITAVAGIASYVEPTDLLVEFSLSFDFSVVHYYGFSDVDGKGRKRLWQVGNW